MRPIELKMTAFGPYQGTEVIDFSKLGDKNLFLVTGPTGAGKTTIFDAISYALYGETSGSDRPEKSVKCQSAPLDILCQVSLSFELHGQVYNVLRIPTQEKLKSRGEGTTQHNAEAILHLPGKIKPETGAKNVTEQIKKIIGLELNQFRQIMMIPQGEFRQLLMAKSDERTNILKQIFKTHLYGHLQEKFRAKSLELEKNLKNYQQEKESLCHQIEVLGEDESSLLLKEALRQDVLNVAKICEYLKVDIQGHQTSLDEGKTFSIEIKKMIERLIIQKEQFQANNEKLRQLDLLKEKIQTLEKSGDSIAKDRILLKTLGQVLEIFPFERDHIERKKEIEVKENEEKNLINKKAFLLERLEILKKDKKKVTGPDYISDLEALKDQIKAYGNFEESLLGVKAIDEKLIISSKRLKSEEENLEAMGQSIEKDKHTLEALDAKIQKKDDLKDCINGLENKYHQKLQLKDKLNEVSEATKKLIARQVELQLTLKLLKEKEQLMTASEEEYKDQKRQYFLNQAALLALDLEPDMACPVCGSKDHVALAEFKGQVVTEDQLKAYEQAYNQDVVNFRTVENDYNIASAEYKQGLKGLMSDLNKLLKDDHIDEIPDNLESKESMISSRINILSQELVLLKNDLDIANNQLKTIEESNKEKIKLDIKHKNDLQRMDGLKELLQNLRLELGKLETQRQTMVENIPEDLQNIKVLIQAKEKAQVNLKDKLAYQEKIINNFENINKQWIEITSKLESLQALIQDLAYKAVKAKEVFIEELKKRQLSQENYESLKAKINLKNDLEKKIHDYDQDLHSFKETHKHLKSSLKYDEIKDLESLENEIESLKIKEASHDEKMSLLSQNIKHNGHLLDQIKVIDLKVNKYESEYYNIGKISKIINGKNNKNMTFEGYILAIYLKDILNVANHRLLAMTNNRFHLKVSETLMDKRGTGGLDLEVYDAYTGLERSVKTLSGGESFKASLAMALGLAEVVQSYAGGIALDTVFIDEGFGTLDQNSLDTAINCLVDLQDSGRLVGIISHVQELKERIKTQLVITSDEGSSSTEFIVD